jgi:UDP-2,3-diacylglucosamine pyrophosphatase LpxH
MLVFLSDIHMTDGSSGETIKSTAFKIFSENVQKLVDSLKPSPPEELRLVLLGDVFDIIRSRKWLDVPERPWDKAGQNQEKIVTEILGGILANNQDSLNELQKIRNWSNEKGIPFEITYVMGNHDWLINRYPGCRKMVADALGISGNAPFPTEFFNKDYKVFARHGDMYDPFNYMGNRDDSSLGDAIVIELLNKFPEQVGKNLKKLVSQGAVTSAEANRLTHLLKEIDNIRPLLSAPSWVLMVMTKTTNESARKTIEKTWTDCVNDFFKVPFVKKQDKFLWPDMVDLLQIALQLSSHMSKKTLEKIMDLKEKWFPDDPAGGYDKHAVAESRVRSGEASFVFYGHTHDHLIIPMDQTPRPDGSTQDKIYFNTGTWRKTWNRAKFDPSNREFIGWYVLTYVALFKSTENGDYNFEVWNGSLG